MAPPEAREQLRLDFSQVADLLATLARQTLAAGVTKYPVFVATEQEIALGLPALAREHYQLTFHFRLSLLEELVQKRLFTPERLPEFRSALGDPNDRACILLVHAAGAEFVFLPYEPAEPGVEDFL